MRKHPSEEQGILICEKLDHISNQLDNLTSIIFEAITQDKTRVFIHRQAGKHLVSRPYKDDTKP